MHCWAWSLPYARLLCRTVLQVFGPDTTQERLYSTAVSSIVTEVLEGFNCTIFACEHGCGRPAGQPLSSLGEGTCYAATACRLLQLSPDSAGLGTADGQTGTGKTHTMTGDIADDLTAGAGVIPRAIHQIFSHLEGEAACCLAVLLLLPSFG